MFKFKTFIKKIRKLSFVKKITSFILHEKTKLAFFVVLNTLLNGIMGSFILKALFNIQISIFTILGSGFAIRYFEGYLKLFKEYIIDIIRKVK